MNQSPHQFISQVMREKLRGLKSLRKYATQTSVPEKPSIFALSETQDAWAQNAISKVKTLISRFQRWRAQEGRQVHRVKGTEWGLRRTVPRWSRQLPLFANPLLPSGKPSPVLSDLLGFPDKQKDPEFYLNLPIFKYRHLIIFFK